MPLSLPPVHAMFFASIPLFLLFASVTIAVPILEGRQAAVSALSTADIASYKPYTYYAAAAHCPPASTLAWNCGASCSANAEFKPIASGGDGALTQYCRTIYGRIVCSRRIPGKRFFEILPSDYRRQIHFETVGLETIPGHQFFRQNS